MLLVSVNWGSLHYTESSGCCSKLFQDSAKLIFYATFFTQPLNVSEDCDKESAHGNEGKIG